VIVVVVALVVALALAGEEVMEWWPDAVD